MKSLSRFLGLTSPQAALPPPASDSSGAPAPDINVSRGRDTAKRYKITTAIPTGALLTGDVALNESCIIGGTIEGRLLVAGKGMAAFIKPGGAVRGGIKADIVVVYGDVIGPVEAEYVHVHTGGSVRGPISAQGMRVERGGLYIGPDSMIAPPVSAQRPTSASDPIDASASTVAVSTAFPQPFQPAQSPLPPHSPRPQSPSTETSHSPQSSHVHQHQATSPHQARAEDSTVVPIRKLPTPDELREALARMRSAEIR